MEAELYNRVRDLEKLVAQLIDKYVPLPGAAQDAVNHPEHYGGDTVYEVIKVIEAWGLGFHLGNAVKYIARAGKKDPARVLEDLRKAAWYLERKIASISDPEICSECNGTGAVYRTVASPCAARSTALPTRCYRCNGTGRIARTGSRVVPDATEAGKDGD